MASTFLPNLEVLGEIRTEDNLRNNSDYEIVVLVKRYYSNGFDGLDGKKLCHPGFNMDQVTGYMLKEFEILALKKNNHAPCEGEGTIEEMHVNHLNKLFGKSCRPGPWVSNPDLDKQLSKYQIILMCTLC